MNKCRCCHNMCEESWMIIKNDNLILDTEGYRAPKFIHYCSYLCSVGDRQNLPKNIWHLVQNKEDFNKDPRPITLRQKKQFHYLTYVELQTMTDEEKYNYYQEKDEQLDARKNNLYDELEREDEYTSQIENQSDDNYSNDDY
jgi:hypothetical protein